MAYAPPTIGPVGLSIPSYNDILQDNIQQYLAIFGANQYVGIDSAIYQLLSIISLKQSDTCQGLQFAYNQRSPKTAVGSGLDQLVKLNGIARLPYSFSTATVTITGDPGTIINNGAVLDVNGNRWLLPSPQVITGGSVDVIVTSQTAGNVTAEPNTINIIATPVGGWATANNADPAVPGNPVETDSQLRARQAISVSLPSRTMLTGTVAGIAAIVGVTRYNVLENPTGVVDAYGNPAHSITAVVEGGTDLQVATAIYNNRGIGCLTNGLVNGILTPESRTVTITDPITSYTMPISFLRPTYVPIYVVAQVHLLPGGTSDILTSVHDAIVTYLNSLEIGEIVTLSAIYAAAMAVTPDLLVPLFSIRLLTISKNPSTPGTSDITINFNEVAQGISGNVTVTEV